MCVSSAAAGGAAGDWAGVRGKSTLPKKSERQPLDLCADLCAEKGRRLGFRFRAAPFLAVSRASSFGSPSCHHGKWHERMAYLNVAVFSEADDRYEPPPMFHGRAHMPSHLRHGERRELNAVTCKQFAGEGCGIEQDEWVAVEALVPPHATVLEFGGRYGTTSCWLAHATNNSGRVAVVEPDERAHAILRANRNANQCNFAIVAGMIASSASPSPRRFVPSCPNCYNSRTVPFLGARRNEPFVPQVHWQYVQQRLGAKIDTLLFDCEGCLQDFVGGEEGRSLIAQAKLILIEEDGFNSHPGYYGRFWSLLRKYGYRRTWQTADTTGMPKILHSAWSRSPVSAQSCEAFQQLTKYDHEHLRCMALKDYAIRCKRGVDCVTIECNSTWCGDGSGRRLPS